MKRAISTAPMAGRTHLLDFHLRLVHTTASNTAAYSLLLLLPMLLICIADDDDVDDADDDWRWIKSISICLKLWNAE